MEVENTTGPKRGKNRVERGDWIKINRRKVTIKTPDKPDQTVMPTFRQREQAIFVNGTSFTHKEKVMVEKAVQETSTSLQ
jgi:hypothetical protein